MLCCIVAFGAQPDVRWSIDRVSIEGCGDSLSVNITWSFSEGLVGDNNALVVMPSLRSEMGQAQLTPVAVYGDKVFYQGVFASGKSVENRYVKYRDRLQFTCHDMIAYSPWMDTVRVALSVYRWSRRGGLTLLSSSQKSTYAKPREPEEPSFPWSAKAPRRFPDRTRTVVLDCPVAFAEGSSVFDISYGGNSEEVPSFLKKVKVVSCGKKYNVKSSRLSVALSPDLAGNRPEALSKQCAQSLFSYFQKVGAFKLAVPERSGLGADWNDVKTFVESTAFAEDERLMEIISSDMADGKKGETLRREKPLAWEFLQQRCFPALGRAFYEVTYAPLLFSQPWFVTPVYEDVPEMLTPYDFYYLATDFREDSDDWLAIMTTGARLNEDDPVLNMDVAMSYIRNGSYRGAVPYLRHIGDSDEAKYVYAVWLYHAGRLGEAFDIFEYLKDRGAPYSGIWISAGPFIQWYTNYVKWEKIYN